MRARIHHSLLLLFSIFLISGCVGSMKADMKLSQEKWMDAIPLYQEALIKSPDSNHIKSRLGFCYLKTNQIDKSINHFEEVLKNDPKESFSILYLGIAFINKSEFSKTLKIWKTFNNNEKPFLQKEIKRLMPIVMMAMSQNEAKKALANENELSTLSSGAIDQNTIAVTYFADRSTDKSLSPFQKGLTAMIISGLAKVKALKVVERVRLQALLEEMKLGMTGIVDEKSAPKVGNLLKAENVVAGILTEGSISAAATITSSTTGDSKGTASVTVEMDEFFTLPALLITKYAEILKIDLSEAERAAIGVPHTKSLKAVTFFGQALNAQDAGNWQKAKDLFSLALKEDPKFLLAQEGFDNSPSADAPSKQEISDLNIPAIITAVEHAFDRAEVDQTEQQAQEAAAQSGGGGH